MITERALKKWRREALIEASEPVPSNGNSIKLPLHQYLELNSRIIRMTQELLDQHLMRRN